MNGGHDLEIETPNASPAPQSPAPPVPPPGPAFRPSALGGLAYILLYVVLQLLVAIAAGAVIGIRFAADGPDATDAAAIQNAVESNEGVIGVVSALAGGVVFVALVLWRNRGARRASFRSAVGLTWGRAKHSAVGAGLGIAIAVGYIVVVASMIQHGHTFTPGPVTRMAATPGIDQQLWSAFGLLGSPVLEEFAIRGVLLACFTASWGSWPAAAFTTALFVTFHLSEIQTNLLAGFGIAALSIAATAMRVRSGSLVPAIVTHGAYNATIILLVISA
jgi:membrane protease YdiL (CAAX protease family)